jgi:hypothetical protein
VLPGGGPFHSVAPELWRRYLDLVFDGLRTAAAHPLSQPGLTEQQLSDARPLAGGRRA